MLKHSILVLLILVAGCNTVPPSIDERIARIENSILPAVIINDEPIQVASLTERMAQDKVPGVSVAVINNGELEWARGYGMADVEHQRPVTTETLFQAASVSKPVAAMAALNIVEEGTLHLDTDVNDKLSSWQVPENEFTAGNKVTLRRLLNHTAGTTVWGFPGYAIGDAVPTTVAVLNGEGNTDAVIVYKEPGESWQYSGGGYTIMQRLLSDVAGKPFPEVMSEMVLQPVGMTASTYEQPLPLSRHPEAASGHHSDGMKIEGDWHTYPEMAAAGLWTTPSDLARFAMAIQRAYAGTAGTALTQSTVQQMLTPGMNNHGLGPVISEDSLRFSHGGSNKGFRCRFTAFTEEGSGVVVMTNSANGEVLAQEIILTIAEEYGWAGLKPHEKTVVPLDPSAYELVTGTYRIADVGDLEITFSEGRLIASGAFLDEPLELLPESSTEFFIRKDGTAVQFLSDDGEITGFVIDGILRGARVE